MIILSLDSSARTASAAVIKDGIVVSDFFINNGLTHSQTLMPLVENALKYASLNISDVDLFAVTNGPGSFTGIRIGVAAVKGMADALINSNRKSLNKKCLGISTLECMAYNFSSHNGWLICPVMDARCEQVYTSLFEIKENKPIRITMDDAMSIQELGKALENQNKPVMLVGDGALMCYNKFITASDNIYLAPEPLRYQKAVSAAYAALSYNNECYVDSDALTINYLRLPQAERELRSRKQENAKEIKI